MASQRDIYELLAAHQIGEDWPLKPVLESLHEWRSRFNHEFKLELSEYAIAIQMLSWRRLGQFREGHNGFGLKGEITIAHRHVSQNLSSDRWWRVLGTLLHEMLHGWQQAHGKPGSRNYHNLEFRRKASSLGLIVDTRGVTEYAPSSPFQTLIAAHGVKAPKLAAAVSSEKLGPARSKLRLWVCGCPVRLRVGVAVLQAQCLVCNQRFLPGEGADVDQ